METDRRSEFAAAIDQRKDYYRRLASVNYRLASWTLILAILLGFVGSILVAQGLGNRFLVACLVAMPSLLFAVNAKLNFERKSLWYREKQHKLEALVNMLRYENRSLADVSAMLAELNEKMEERYPKFQEAERIDTSASETRG